MNFNSLTFILFFAVVMLLHQLPLSWRCKKFNLLIASYMFYAAWNPPFVILLWISTALDWFAAKGIARTESRHRKRAFLALSLCVNLGFLGFFKYGGFLLENFVRLMDAVGVQFSAAQPNIVLPVGISFYTFQTLSYTLDVYQGKLNPSRSPLDFALFVTFFPQLVAGPIVRAADFLPQCPEPRRATSAQVGWGLYLLVIGMFEKVILADRVLAPVVDAVYGAWENAGFVDSWTGTVAFAGQIFFDFSGYSTCAIGAALCLGFVLPDNFRFPYAAVGFSDFWRRWHMSLSSWLRDYLYISLGGNRKRPIRTYVNLMLTMLLGGLWHGASWRFVVWGGLHGLFLCTERVVRKLAGDQPTQQKLYVRLFLAGMTYVLVCFTWVFFRAESFDCALAIVKQMVHIRWVESSLPVFSVCSVWVLTVAMLVFQWVLRDSSLEHAYDRLPSWLRVCLVAGMIVALALGSGDSRAFVYFQF